MSNALEPMCAHTSHVYSLQSPALARQSVKSIYTINKGQPCHSFLYQSKAFCENDFGVCFLFDCRRLRQRVNSTPGA